MLENQRPQIGDEAVDLAVEALQKELADLHQFSSPLKEIEGERKLVTVMFADLSGFTAYSEKEDPEIVRKLVNAIFERLAQVIMEYGGFIEKYIGDEIMAIFGAPISYEDHAERALRSALDMMETLKLYNRVEGTHFGIHIGINSGRVVTGIIGARRHQQYGVTGDAVNLAARLKHAAQNGQILIGPETYRLTHRAFECSLPEPMNFKGKQKPVRVYRLLRKRPEQTSRWMTELSSPLVGREKELDVLFDMLNELENGRGGRLAVVGEAGIGKSRLVAEFQKRWDKKVVWAEGRALSYARESAFLPVREILRKLVDASEDLDKLRELVQRDFKYLCKEEAEQHFPFLAYLMQLPLTEEEEERIKYFPPTVLNQKVHAAIKTYLKAKAERRPLVLVWEDLHWADPASLRLIEALMEIVDETPLFLLLVFRPVKEEKIWGLHQQASEAYADGYSTLELGTLHHDQIGSLIGNLMKATSVDRNVNQLIYERTEGNPFFVEELVRSLMDQGILYLEELQVIASAPIDQIQLPATLQGVIASRIDRLDKEDKFLLQAASVLGRIFDRQVLNELLVKAGFHGDMEQSLWELLYRELLREKKQEHSVHQAYIFKHAYTYEVAYNSLLLSHREHLHELAAETFKELAGSKPEDLAALIGYHYERTPAKTSAVHYLKMAADQASNRHINDEAANLYTRALKQLEWLRQRKGDSEERLDLYLTLMESLGDVQEVNGLHKEAIATFEKAIIACEEDSVQLIAHLYRKAGTSYISSRQINLSLERFEQAEKMLEKVKKADMDRKWWQEWIEVQLDRQFLYYFTNRLSEMATSLQQISNEIDEKGTPDQQIKYFQSVVMYRFREEIYSLSDTTIQYARQMMEATRKTRNERVIALSKFVYGLALLFHDDFKESALALKESMENAKRVGDVINQVRSLNYLTVACRRLGNVDETEKYNEQTLSISESIQLTEYLASGNANKAWLTWKEGRIKAAREFGEKGLKYWREFEKMVGYPAPFLWVVCWPLIAAYGAKKKWQACIEQINVLLNPKQRPIEPELQTQLEKVIEINQTGSEAGLGRAVNQAIDLAVKFRYL